MIISSIRWAKDRLKRYSPVYCLFTDAEGKRQRWQLARVTELRKQRGYVRLLNVHGHEATIPATKDLFDDGSR